MFKNEINRLFSEKREYLITLLKEYVEIYISTFLFIENSNEVRNNLTNFIKDYIKYHRLENSILKYIKSKCNKKCYECVCDEIIEELNCMFFKVYNYNEWILSGYKDMLETKQIYRAYIPNKDFLVLDEALRDEYIRKLSKIL